MCRLFFQQKAVPEPKLSKDPVLHALKDASTQTLPLCQISPEKDTAVTNNTMAHDWSLSPHWSHMLLRYKLLSQPSQKLKMQIEAWRKIFSTTYWTISCAPSWPQDWPHQWIRDNAPLARFSPNSLDVSEPHVRWMAQLCSYRSCQCPSQSEPSMTHQFSLTQIFRLGTVGRADELYSLILTVFTALDPLIQLSATPGLIELICPCCQWQSFSFHYDIISCNPLSSPISNSITTHMQSSYI